MDKRILLQFSMIWFLFNILLNINIQGQTISFEQVSYDSNAFSYGNYLYGLQISNRPAPAFCDIDNDGDDDMFIGSSDGLVKYYENTGNDTNVIWVERIGSSNPVNLINVGGYSVPQFTDLNGDNLIDVLCGREDGLTSYFQNSGSDSIPNIGIETPLPIIGNWDIGTYSVPTAGDATSDGVKEIIIGGSDGQIYYFRNVGTAFSPSFSKITGASNPFNGDDYGNNSSPTFFDMNYDGVLDVMVGSESGFAQSYKRNGALFIEFAASSPFEDSIVGENAIIGKTDYDNDGDKDLFIGNESGIIRYYEDVQDHSSTLDPFLIERGIFAIGKFEVPIFIDYNEDGITDIAKVTESGRIAFFLGSLKNGLLNFTKQISTSNPFNGLNISDSSSLIINDIDLDNDFDLLVFNGAGTVEFYENIGNNTFPTYNQVTGILNPFNGQNFGSNHTVKVDIDNDGDKDIIICQSTGTIKYFRNDCTTGSPLFTEVTGGSNPLSSFDCSLSRAITFGDFDYDGDPDAFLGTNTGTFRYLENTGTASIAIYSEITGIGNPLNGLDIGNYSKPVAFDYNNDGDIDLLLSDIIGRIEYYDNKINTAVLTKDFAYHVEFVNDTINFTISDTNIVDPDVLANNDTIYYAAKLYDGSPLPAFLSFNDTTKTFTGISTESDSGTYKIILIVHDRFFTYDTINFDFVINEYPIKTGSLKDQNWETGKLNIYDYSSDVSYDDANNLIYHIENLGGSQPPQWFFFNPNLKKILGDPNSAGSYTFVISISDEYNATIYDTLTINITGKTIGINNLQSNNKLILFPVPAKNKIFIRADENGTISIFDMIGKLRYSNNIKINTLEVDLNNYASGNYFCIFQNEKTRIIKQFIKE